MNDLSAEILSELREIRARLDAVDMTPKPQWIGISDMAEREGVSVATVRRWVREGKVQAAMVNGRRKVRSI